MGVRIASCKSGAARDDEAGYARTSASVPQRDHEIHPKPLRSLPGQLRLAVTAQPEITVVVPTYNEVKTIAQVLASLRELPFTTQIIVVNDTVPAMER